MAFCVNCGKEIVDGAKFCANCGKSVNVQGDISGQQRIAVYDGKIHKCPKCGEDLNAFVTICPVCNYELRDTGSTSRVHELSLHLENAKGEEEKIELISNFYIPNTKEDIYEFFILAYSNISAGGYGVEAWIAKLEQAYLKAKLAFQNIEEFKYIDELYSKIKREKKLSKPKREEQKSIVAIALGLLLMVFGFILTVAMPILGFPILAIGIIVFFIGLFIFIKPKKKR